jgi:hypothetical protein
MSLFDMSYVMSFSGIPRRRGECLAALCLGLLVASPADGGGFRSSACVGREFSYAGLQSKNTAGGVAATIAPTAAPFVSDGHVGGWIGVGGTDAGPRGVAEWIQVGLAAFTSDRASRMFYEVTVAGSEPRYVELAATVKRGEEHRFVLLELASRKSWWRVAVDGRPVSGPIHLPGSHGTWYPQAAGENWNGGTGTCNAYAYRFSNVRLTRRGGAGWQPVKSSYVFHDPGYRVVQTSRVPRSFIASSLGQGGLGLAAMARNGATRAFARRGLAWSRPRQTDAGVTIRP